MLNLLITAILALAEPPLPIRDLASLEEPQGRPVVIRVYDIPQSSFIKIKGRDQRFIFAGDATPLVSVDGHYRFYVPETPDAPYLEFENLFRQNRKPDLQGKKIRGVGRYWIQPEGFILQVPPDRKQVSPQDVIKSNSWVSKALQDGDRVASVDMLPMVASLRAAQVNGSGYTYSIQAPQSHPNEKSHLVPLDKLLSDKELANQVAKRKGFSSGEEWLVKTVAPELGHFFAEMNYRHGVFFKDNRLYLKIHEDTGEIEKVVLGDPSTCFFSNAHRVLAGKNPIFLRTFAAEEDFRPLWSTDPMSIRVNPNDFAVKTLEKIKEATPYVNEQKVAKDGFVKAYIDTVSKILGVPLEVKALKAEDALEKLREIAFLRKSPKIEGQGNLFENGDLALAAKSLLHENPLIPLCDDAVKIKGKVLESPEAFRYKWDGKTFWIFSVADQLPVIAIQPSDFQITHERVKVPCFKRVLEPIVR